MSVVAYPEGHTIWDSIVIEGAAKMSLKGHLYFFYSLSSYYLIVIFISLLELSFEKYQNGYMECFINKEIM